MTIKVKHPFVSAKADGPNSTLVKPSNWNADHDVTSDNAGFVAGRDNTGSGPLQELPLIWVPDQNRWQFNATGSLLLPKGTTGQRPGTPTTGDLRFNTSTMGMEIYISPSWIPFTPTLPGTIIAYGGTGTPGGYLDCNGARVNRATYPNLFTAIGLSWDPTDDGSTFLLPNLRGRVLVGRDTNGSIIGANTDVGDVLGTKDVSVTLAANQLPAHKHPIEEFPLPVVSPTAGTTPTTGSKILAQAGDEVMNTTEDNTGGGQPVVISTVQPSAGVKLLIKY